MRESVAGCVTKGGRSPTGVANLAIGAALQGAVFSGGHGRADRKPVLHTDEEPQLARPPHHRLPDEAIYEFPPSRDADHCGGQSRVQRRHRLSYRTGSTAAVAKESAAWPPT